MHEIDAKCKAFFSVPQNFADLVNSVVFKGHPVINPNDLENAETEIISEDEGKSFFVDVAKTWILKNIKVTIIAIENQNYVDYGMIIRNMRTELLNYIKQVNAIKEYHKEQKDLKGDEFLSGISKSDLLTPVITVVVYLGEEPWDGPRELYDVLDIDNKIAMAVNNYKLNLFDYHEYQDASLFTGEVKKILEILKIRSNKNAIQNYAKNNRYMYKTTGELMNALVGIKMDKNNVIKTAKGENMIDMCKGLAELCEDYRKEGIEQGIITLVHSFKDIACSKEVVIIQLVKQYNLAQADAEEYVRKYW